MRPPFLTGHGSYREEAHGRTRWGQPRGWPSLPGPYSLIPGPYIPIRLVQRSLPGRRLKRGNYRLQEGRALRGWPHRSSTSPTLSRGNPKLHRKVRGYRDGSGKPPAGQVTCRGDMHGDTMAGGQDRPSLAHCWHTVACSALGVHPRERVLTTDGPGLSDHC